MVEKCLETVLVDVTGVTVDCSKERGKTMGKKATAIEGTLRVHRGHK